MSAGFRGRGGPYQNRGRGRGGYNPSYGFNYGSNRTSSSSSSSNRMPIPVDSLYEEFQQFMKTKESNTPNYSKVISSDNNDENFGYKKSSHKDEIILLENNDIMLYFENDNNPWFLMTRYLENASYAGCSYKHRSYYENILKTTESVEFQHFQTSGNRDYNFSKAVIKKLILPNEWGLNTLREREFTIPESNSIFKFTYWDYIESFNKAFLYENSQRKHTWFFKVCGNIYNNNRTVPNWFRKWWESYGPHIDILPEDPFRNLYGKWLPISPKYKQESMALIEKPNLEVISSMHYFMEFSIPWIWKWEPVVDHTPNKFPTLQRIYFTKFWQKMFQIDQSTNKLYAQDIIDLINNKIEQYQEQNEFAQRNSMKLIKNTPENNMTKEEMIKAYLNQMKEELKKFKDDDNISMASANSQNSFSILAGESQPEEEIPIDSMIDMIGEQLLQKKDKGIME